MNNPFLRHNPSLVSPIDDRAETALRAALTQAYVVERASPALRERVALLAMQQDQRRVMTAARYPRLLRHSLSLAGAVFVVVAVFAWPQIKTAYLLYRMQSAIAHARTISAFTRYTRGETTTWVEQANRSNAADWVWVQDGRWHIETATGPNTFFDGSHLSFFHSRNTPTTQAISAGQARPPVIIDTRSPLSQYRWIGITSLTESPASAAVLGLYSHLERLGDEDINGCHTVKYAWKPYYYDQPHTFLWLDALNCAPVQIKVEAQRKGIWIPYSTTLFGFNNPPRDFR